MIDKLKLIELDIQEARELRKLYFILSAMAIILLVKINIGSIAIIITAIPFSLSCFFVLIAYFFSVKGLKRAIKDKFEDAEKWDVIVSEIDKASLLLFSIGMLLFLIFLIEKVLNGNPV